MWARGRVKLHSLLRMKESFIWCELGDEGRMGDSVSDNIESFICRLESWIEGSFTVGRVDGEDDGVILGGISNEGEVNRPSCW